MRFSRLIGAFTASSITLVGVGALIADNAQAVAAACEAVDQVSVSLDGVTLTEGNTSTIASAAADIGCVNWNSGALNASQLRLDTFPQAVRDKHFVCFVASYASPSYDQYQYTIDGVTREDNHVIIHFPGQPADLKVMSRTTTRPPLKAVFSSTPNAACPGVPSPGVTLSRYAYEPGDEDGHPTLLNTVSVPGIYSATYSFSRNGETIPASMNVGGRTLQLNERETDADLFTAKNWLPRLTAKVVYGEFVRETPLDTAKNAALGELDQHREHLTEQQYEAAKAAIQNADNEGAVTEAKTKAIALADKRVEVQALIVDLEAVKETEKYKFADDQSAFDHALEALKEALNADDATADSIQEKVTSANSAKDQLNGDTNIADIVREINGLTHLSEQQKAAEIAEIKATNSISDARSRSQQSRDFDAAKAALQVEKEKSPTVVCVAQNFIEPKGHEN